MGRARQIDSSAAERPRWRRPWPWTPSIIVALLLAAVGLRLWWRSDSSAASLLEEGPCRIEGFEAGGIFVLDRGHRLRLIGIFDVGVEAREFIESFVAEKAVRLEFDKERVDSRGVYSGYLWIEEQLLNEALVRQGLARADSSARIASGMKTRLRHAETAARAAGCGRWASP